MDKMLTFDNTMYYILYYNIIMIVMMATRVLSSWWPHSVFCKRHTSECCKKQCVLFTIWKAFSPRRWSSPGYGKWPLVIICIWRCPTSGTRSRLKQRSYIVIIYYSNNIRRHIHNIIYYHCVWKIVIFFVLSTSRVQYIENADFSLFM